MEIFLVCVALGLVLTSLAIALSGSWVAITLFNAGLMTLYVYFRRRHERGSGTGGGLGAAWAIQASRYIANFFLIVSLFTTFIYFIKWVI